MIVILTFESFMISTISSRVG